MSARDVIAKALREHTRVQASLHCSELILEALDKAGYAVVPKGPTANMILAGEKVSGEDSPLIALRVWGAMLTAAKKTP